MGRCPAMRTNIRLAVIDPEMDMDGAVMQTVCTVWMAHEIRQ